jgi:hypothetical protein
MCTSQHTHYAGGIKVAIVTQVHDGTHKRIYNKSQRLHESRIQIYNTKIQIIHKANNIRVPTRIQMGLRGLKINDGVQTLLRPSRKGNLANVVAAKPVNKNRANGCRTRREKEKREKMRVSTEARTRETRIQLCSPTGYMVDLAATKALNYRGTLQLSSK